MMIKKGDRVVCANHDGIDPKFIGWFYPEVGTFGTALGNSGRYDTYIQWDQGTAEEQRWFMNNENLALAEECVEFDSEIDDLLGSIYKEKE